MMDSSEVVVRRATRADLPRLGRLGASLVETHHAFDSDRFLPTRNRTPADYAHFLADQIENPDSVVLVADDHGDLVGYSFATLEGFDHMALRGPAGVIQDIVVDVELRRRGIGGALFDATIAELTSHDVPQIVLSTAALNNEAQRLFARGGFHATMIEMTRTTHTHISST